MWWSCEDPAIYGRWQPPESDVSTADQLRRDKELRARVATMPTVLEADDSMTTEWCEHYFGEQPVAFGRNWMGGGEPALVDRLVQRHAAAFYPGIEDCSATPIPSTTPGGGTTTLPPALPAGTLTLSRFQPLEVYAIDIGSSTIRLLAAAGFDASPVHGRIAWSNDGTRLAVTDMVNREPDTTFLALRILDTVTGNWQELPLVTEPGDRERPVLDLAWAPDSSSVAAILGRGEQTGDLLHADVVSATVSTVAEAGHGSVTWTSTGRIAATTTVGVELIDPETGLTEDIYELGYRPARITASSTKPLVALVGEDGAAILDLESGAVVVLETRGLLPVWSPDGQRVAVMVDDGAVFTVAPDTGKDRVYVFPGGQRNWGCVAWAPDGRWLARELNGEPLTWAPASGGQLLTWDPTEGTQWPLTCPVGWFEFVPGGAPVTPPSVTSLPPGSTVTPAETTTDPGATTTLG